MKNFEPFFYVTFRSTILRDDTLPIFDKYLYIYLSAFNCEHGYAEVSLKFLEKQLRAKASDLLISIKKLQTKKYLIYEKVKGNDRFWLVHPTLKTWVGRNPMEVK